MKLTDPPHLHPSNCRGCEYCHGDTPSPPASRTPTVPSPSQRSMKPQCRACSAEASPFLGLCYCHAKLYMPAPTDIGALGISIHLPFNPYVPMHGIPQDPPGRPLMQLVLRDDGSYGRVTSEQARIIAAALLLYADRLDVIERNMEVP